MLRAFRRRGLWLGAWIAMILGVIVLSLIPKPPIPAVLTVDKFDHGFAYFCLAAMAAQLYARRRDVLFAAMLFATLGIALEFAQGFLTDYRDMSSYDGMVDCVGVLVGLATAWTPLRGLLQKIDARLP